MIRGLLSGRVLGGAPPSGVVAAPEYPSVYADASGPSSATATANFRVQPDGTFTYDGTGYLANSGSWYRPTTAAIGDGYEIRITPTQVSGVAGTRVNDAANWVALSASRLFQLSVQRFTAGTSTSTWSLFVEIRQVGGAVVSTGTVQITATATTSGDGSGGGGCPALDMWLRPGQTVEEAGVGQRIDAVHSDAPEELTRLEILAMSASVQPCHRLVTSNGAACVLSDTTPFTLRDGSSRLAPYMLGEEVLRDDGAGGLVWDTVAACYPVGVNWVAKLSIGGHSLLAGENPLMRIVSHNLEKV